jgi:glycosyltransferase involved in cell wall biosynthesis
MSGWPFYFLQAGGERGLFDGFAPTRMADPSYQARRAAWTLNRLVRTCARGGFLMTQRGIDTVWRKVRITGPCRIVNCFQLYPLRILRDPRVSRWYFIDQTLAQLLEGYGYPVPAEIARQALGLERLGYEAAEGIIVHSRWAACSVIDDYGVAPEKVYVVPQAANLDAQAVEDWWQTCRPKPPNGSLRLLFVGRDWQRKGLDRLLRGFREVRRRGSQLELEIVGVDASDVPKDLATTEGASWYGLIDKRNDADRFMRIVGRSDIGCLLSRNEAGGIGLHEYHALGLAVLGTLAGGAPEQVLNEASVLVSPAESVSQIADRLVALDRDRDRVAQMKAHARIHRRNALWPARIDQILDFWPAGEHVRG